MDNIDKTPKKSAFIHGQLFQLHHKYRKQYKNIKKIVDGLSCIETIGHIPKNLSNDNKKRPIILSKEIIQKIENDHGKICIENLIVNVHEWEYAVVYPYKNIDKINLIKTIPNSHNYLIVAANRINGFYIVTHFETKSKNDKNLKRLLGRGNVVNRGPSVCLHTNQGTEPTREGV